MAGGEGGNGRQNGWMAFTDSMDMHLSKLQEMVKDREAWHGAVYGSQATEQQQSQTLRNTALEQINKQIANYGATSFCWKLVVLVLVVQSCPTFCNPNDRSLPGSSVHGISQARMLEQVAISFSPILPNYHLLPITNSFLPIPG